VRPTDVLYLNVLDRIDWGGVDSYFKPVVISDIRC